LEGSLGASSILRSMRAIDSVADLAVDDVGVVTDIDTPEALAQAEALWLARVDA
jgi:molybdenum cofactor cytidylyltransferase